MSAEQEYTTREVAALTDVPQNRIQKYIDAGPIPRQLVQTGNRARRVLTRSDALFVWVLARALPEIELTASLKAVLHEQISRVCEGTTPAEDELHFTPFLTVRRFRELLDELTCRIEKLNRARTLVESNPAIKGGDPVIKGTRVPVHLVAALLRQGASVDEILESYPTLDEEKVELARVYAEANPKAGRPASHPWH